MNPLERVKQLLALAADKSATKEEARTAAHKAASLIVEHGLEVIDPRAPISSQAGHVGWNPPPWASPVDPWDGRVDPSGAGTPAPSNWPPPPGTPASQARNGPPPGYVPGSRSRGRHARAHPTGDMGRVPTPAMHNGKCHYCPATWRMGAVVYWKQGLHMTCVGCRNKGP